MDFQEQRMLIDAVLADWPVKKREDVSFMFKNRKVTAFCFTNDGRKVEAVARLHPLDMYNCRTGAVLALTLLRIKCGYKESGLAKKLRTWVPKEGDIYYVPGFDNDAPEGCKAKTICRVWHNHVDDVMYLAEKLVFRTEQEARKKARNLLYEGRALVNFSKKRDYLHGLGVGFPSETKENNFVIPDKELFLQKQDDTEEEPSWPPLPETKNNENFFASAFLNKKEMSLLVSSDDAEKTIPDDEDTEDDLESKAFELPEDALAACLNLKKGEQYYMDPVTGDMRLTMEDEE